MLKRKVSDRRDVDRRENQPVDKPVWNGVDRRQPDERRKTERRQKK